MNPPVNGPARCTGREAARRTVRAAHLLEHGFQIYDWKRMLKQTERLDTMKMATHPKEVVSIREQVRSYVCKADRKIAQPKKPVTHRPPPKKKPSQTAEQKKAKAVR